MLVIGEWVSFRARTGSQYPLTRIPHSRQPQSFVRSANNRLACSAALQGNSAECHQNKSARSFSKSSTKTKKGSAADSGADRQTGCSRKKQQDKQRDRKLGDVSWRRRIENDPLSCRLRHAIIVFQNP